jgi:hypothetical protein
VSIDSLFSFIPSSCRVLASAYHHNSRASSTQRAECPRRPRKRADEPRFRSSAGPPQVVVVMGESGMKVIRRYEHGRESPPGDAPPR